MIGVDEVGRGAWAGPLLVCAARLRKPIAGLKDSKQLTAKMRQQLALRIQQSADIGFGWVTAQEIDDFGLSNALRLGTERALTEIAPRKGEKVIIDGTINFAPQFNTETLIKADQTIPAVSAASIAAKVARDTYMQTIAATYPNYQFERHVGYGTAAHRLAIGMYGYCAEHRRSFKIKSNN